MQKYLIKPAQNAEIDGPLTARKIKARISAGLLDAAAAVVVGIYDSSGNFDGNPKPLDELAPFRKSEAPVAKPKHDESDHAKDSAAVMPEEPRYFVIPRGETRTESPHLKRYSSSHHSDHFSKAALTLLAEASRANPDRTS